MPIKNIPPGEWKLTIIDPNSTFETMGYFIKIGDNTTAISSCILQKDYPQAEYSQQEIEAIGKLLHAAPKLYEAVEWARDQFVILANKGLYPEHLMVENGGNGLRVLTDALKLATE